MGTLLFFYLAHWKLKNIVLLIFSLIFYAWGEPIYIILMTRMKERAMLPDFGSNLHEYIFALPDSDFEIRIGSEIREALMKYEPRVINVGVEIDTRDIQNGTVYLNISYTVRATNNPNNLVFPYYLIEGVGEL